MTMLCEFLNIFSTGLWQGVAAADPEAYLQNLCSVLTPIHPPFSLVAS